MKITLSNLLGHSDIFKKISSSDEFINKIFTVTASLREEPFSSHQPYKLSHTCSLESIDSGYESDSENVNDTKLLNTDEFKHKVNQLKGNLYKLYSPAFHSEQDAESLIKENQTVLDEFNRADKEMYGHANFLYRYVKIPGINNENQQEKSDIIENFVLPKPLTNKNGSMLPLKKQLIQEHIRHITPTSEDVKYKEKNKFIKKLVYIHYKTCEENQPNRSITPLPKTTFEFKGNIPQTKSSLLRNQRIKERYNLSNKSTTQKNTFNKYHLEKNKISIKHSDLLKIEKSIEKEYNLIQEMNRNIETIAEIDAQMKANSQLLETYKV
ncbi:TPA: hypothetical protein ACKRTE_003257 [Providencia rettgeri]